ncbi:MAG: hypothetical protein Q7K26_00580 [bacterium]|nr:hypothetical protein [bacterium]
MIQTFLTSLCDGIFEDFGSPVNLMRLIRQYPNMRVDIAELNQSIAYDSVVPWHKLGNLPNSRWPRPDTGTLVGWRKTGNQYSGFSLNIIALVNFGHCYETKSWTCEIQDVDGLANSKSTLTDFSSLDDMVTKNSPAMVKDLNEAGLEVNLAHSAERIFSDTHFENHLWDGRLFLMNIDGSHHFSAARLIAGRIGKLVPLKGRLSTNAINAASVKALCREYDLFVISDDAAIANAFYNAMESFGATYLGLEMPKPYENTRAILLPRNETRSVRVSKALREAGMFDFGKYLAQLCDRQDQQRRLAA